MRAVMLYAKRRAGYCQAKILTLVKEDHNNHKAIALIGEKEQNTCTELDDLRFK